MDNLATALLALGFIPVLGTVENIGHGIKATVQRGAPKRYDWNNDVTVVYDETGVPWIIRSMDLKVTDFEVLRDSYDLRGGVRVPHCNDGGAFLGGNVPSVGTSC